MLFVLMTNLLLSTHKDCGGVWGVWISFSDVFRIEETCRGEGRRNVLYEVALCLR